MKYLLQWDEVAIETLVAESEFILKKWNYKEVQIFESLVSKHLDSLVLNPFIGVFDERLKVYKLVISKQTSLFYSINETSNSICLHVFWNNQRNPSELKNILEK